MIAYIASSLVDDPDAVEVNVVEEDRAIVLELTVAPDDLGKVIGKEGRTARAMRTSFVVLYSSNVCIDGANPSA